MSKIKRYQITLEDLQHRATVSVEQAAYLLGISRQAGYNAVERGEFEVLKVGKRVLVLARPLYNKLCGSASDLATRSFETADLESEGLTRCAGSRTGCSASIELAPGSSRGSNS